MKKKSLLPFFALFAVLTWRPMGRATAQTFTTLHTFTSDSASTCYTNSDGANPNAGLVLSGNTLYGTAYFGGSSDAGTVFAINTGGTSFTSLHSFSANYYDTGDYYTNSGGRGPTTGLVLSGDTLYGTASGGGYGIYGDDGGSGTVFALKTDGTAFTTLHMFEVLSFSSPGTNSDGYIPQAELVLSGSTLYGTAYRGGSSGYGTLFKIDADDSAFTNLHNFSEKDGVYPAGGLVLSGKTLYGVTVQGGDSGNGMVFAINTDGTGFTNLHSFNYNIDGGYPRASLILSGNTLYGTAQGGGSSGEGTVFSLHTDGSGFRKLYNFTALSVPYYGTNRDGAAPTAGLTLSGNTLYGTASRGGSSGSGTVFALHTDGTGFTNLHNFTALSADPNSTNSDGATPFGGLVLADNTLYGTTAGGGSSDNGTVFSLSFRPQLTLTRSETNVILSWPTNVAGFDYTAYTLQSTTNLVSPVAWSTNSAAPVIVNGQNTVTNPISVAQQFYRLSQ